MDLRYGHLYKVVEGSGLLSGKVGVLVRAEKHRKQIEQEEGRYQPFDATKEVALLDEETGKIFTMFISRIKEIK